MRTIKLWPAFAACAALSAVPLSGWAQQQTGDAPPPPKLEKLEEGEAPAVTIRKPSQERKITEKRAPGGKVTEVKVSSGKNTYYVKPNDPSGSAVAGDMLSNEARPAQWEVLEFDFGRPKEAKQEQAEQTAPVPPAPAASAPAKK
ncbi:MAG TPA: DUF2782 domain-containing protein [Noviherbaspirillum sp.]|nr:DUF2782 domain-containing protein [Noviherbaspirillum sp.]